MKKTFLFFVVMASTCAMYAQWTNDTLNNNLIAESDVTGTVQSGGVITVTDPVTNDTYIQWCSGVTGGNGFGPSVQRLTADGTPQWGNGGIRFNQFNYMEYSPGNAIAIASDHDLLSCFSIIADGNDSVTVAMRLHPDGTYAWGENGILLFDGHGGLRAEIIAGNDGGAWALGSGWRTTYLQYINADGTLNPLITLESDIDSIRYIYGKLLLRSDNSVFLTYEHIWIDPNGYSDYGTKEIHLRGYAVNGTQTLQDVTLMEKADCVTPYCHHIEPDGLGGAYVYLAFGGDSTGFFNTHVFHYDANGTSTIDGPYGVVVHPGGQQRLFKAPYAAVDPVSHDLLITYHQANGSQEVAKVCINRISSTGEYVWGDQVVVFDSHGNHVVGLTYISPFEDGSGLAVIYFVEDGLSANLRFTVEAVGYDMDTNVLWRKQLCSNTTTKKHTPENITGFHNGQNIVAWTIGDEGDVYGQNLFVDGTTGVVVGIRETPVIDDNIVSVARIFDVSGRLLPGMQVKDLRTGVYILQGTNQYGQKVSKKIVVVR